MNQREAKGLHKNLSEAEGTVQTVLDVFDQDIADSRRNARTDAMNEIAETIEAARDALERAGALIRKTFNGEDWK